MFKNSTTRKSCREAGGVTALQAEHKWQLHPGRKSGFLGLRTVFLKCAALIKHFFFTNLLLNQKEKFMSSCNEELLPLQKMNIFRTPLVHSS